MRIGLQLLLGYFIIVAVAGFFVLDIFVQEVKPGVRRAVEGTLNDTASLLAQFAHHDLVNGTYHDGVLTDSSLQRAFQRVNSKPIGANIAGIRKNHNEYRVYLTDANGKVVFDSNGEALGQDYSRWNDVWLTLRGSYGARSTLMDPNNPESSVMYVAAPIYDGDRIIGVLSVGKPNLALAPVIQRSEHRILVAGAALLGIALLVGLFFVWWINRSIGRLVKYATLVSEGHPVTLPKMNSIELRRLAEALEHMRIRLEGKNYVEQYVHTLTHELKSPLAAIRGAAEILQEQPPVEVAQRFTLNIQQQSQRIQLLIDKMLTLAKIESRVDAELESLNIAPLLLQIMTAHEAQARQTQITLQFSQLENCTMHVDPWLLTQAIENLLANALDFTPPGGTITLIGKQNLDVYSVILIDDGAGIPDYALPHIFDRFYSLPRTSGQKSSGLGLSFVLEVARLHQGEIILANRSPQGVEAQLLLPIK